MTMIYKCRVLYETGTGRVVWVLHPAMRDRTRPTGMSDEEWATRCLDQTLAKHLEWRDYATLDCLNTALPDKATRSTWCVRAGRVMPE